MMNCTKLAISVALATTIGLMSLSNANASACTNPNVVQIKFAKGAYCWSYEGTATHFRGWFRKGQRLQVKMSYPGSPAGGTHPTDWMPRDIDASGPNEIFLSSNGPSGSFEQILPLSGTYEIGFAPCVMWHSFGRVVICAR